VIAAHVTAAVDQAMLGFVRRRAFLTFLGFVLLAVVIWYAGPLFSFADYVPLESVNARIVLFLLIVALWAALKVLKRLRAYRAGDRLVAAVVRQASPRDERPSAEAVQLRERFESGVATLKQSRRGGHSLYDLPWYIIIGAPGSGKTTALLNSGLKFPLEQRMGKGALRGVGGTRNCDWWFTDEAIFLDTAGRYTTQDSDAESDAAGWSEFLSLLKKYRTRRPLNGIILTISAQDLITQGARGREIHVEAARRRLNEVYQQLNIQLPVYVMVTKCDLVAGFMEYFDDLAQEGRAQVWGVTFPYDQTLNGEATQMFPAEFDQLMARLNARVFARVEEDRDVRRRSRIFAFPQQMAALRDTLAEFVAEVFTSTRLDQQILLRGVYLTSGTQEGTPIDRLLGAIGRRYGVAPEAVAPPTGRGKAYFVERLLKEVMLAESGLAGVNRRLELKKAGLQLAAYAALALVAVLGILAFSVSYNRNRAFIDETAGELKKFQETHPPAAATAPEALLPRLNALRGVVDVANRYRNDTPWSMRWGLFQGTSLGNSARMAYVHELDSTLLPRVAARIEERLVEYGSQPEKLYEYLKAYLMLGEPRHLSKDHLQFVANLEWNASDNADPDAAAALSRHFKSLLDYGESLSPIAMNKQLIAQARNTIGRASIPTLIYSRLKRVYREDTARQVHLDIAAGIGAEKVLRRKGASLSQPVPSFFTRAVFPEVATKQVPDLVKGFADDDWVWGDGGSAARGALKLSGNVVDLYEQDYITTWDGVLNDVQLAPFGSPAEAADALAILSAPTSPLRALYGIVSENTLLVQAGPAPPATGAAGAAAAAGKAITDKLGPATNALGGLFGDGGKAPRTPGTLVTAHFQPIHRLMSGDPAPIDGILLRLGQVEQQLRTMKGVTSLQDPQLQDILRSLKQETAGMPPVIQSLASQVGQKAEGTVVEGAASELETRYVREMQRDCAQIVTGRYPFTPGGSTDIPLRDFANLFGYGVGFDRFFKENLEPLVDRSQTPWTWKSGAGAQAPRGILEQFERAQLIRDQFFKKGSGEFETKFFLTVAEVDTSSIRFALDLDANRFEYKPPPQPMIAVWPGSVPTATSITWFERYGGTPRTQFTGTWAWFRLLDSAHQERENEVRTSYTFQGPNGHRARIVVEAPSIVNPFSNRDWQRFSCQF
jgi:type VI secretion system protein ImpL